MRKEDILNELKEAKISHVRWHAYAEALALGVESYNDKTPISSEDCDFGKWYYSVGQLLNFTHNFSSIEPFHKKLHIIYSEIFTMCNYEMKKGSKTKKKLELTTLVNKLKEVTSSMLTKIENLENELNKMTTKQLVSSIMAKKYQYVM